MALALRETPRSSGEQDLVGAVRAGDDRAFEQLFSRYRRRISGYVYALVGDYGRAEDITQEVFISALRRLRETDQAIAFKPWIYEIARNACIDEFRRARRTAVVPLDDEQAQRALHGSDSLEGSPEACLELSQQMRNLFGAFSGLSENHHQILVLRELEGLSYAQIAARMGISRPVVESTLFRARRRLTQEYAELDSGRRCEDVRAVLDGADVRGLARLGVRERRRIAVHLNHCQDCVRHARVTGVDSAAFEAPSVGRRVAALIPFGWLPAALRRARAAAAARHGGAAIMGRTAQRASSMADGAAPGIAFGRAVAAAAALFAVGGGFSGAAAGGHTTAPLPQIRHAHMGLPASSPAQPRAQQRAPATVGRHHVAKAPAVHARSAAPREPIHGVRVRHQTPSGPTRAPGPATRAGAPSAPGSVTSITLPSSLGGVVPAQPAPSLPSLPSPPPTLGQVASQTLGQVADQVGSVLPPVGRAVTQATGAAGGTAAGTIGTVLGQTAAGIQGTTTTLESLQPAPGG